VSPTRPRLRLASLAFAWVIAGLLALLPACVQDDGERFRPMDLLVPRVSDDDARELGMEFDRELQRVIPVIDDPVVTDFIFELGQAIVRSIEPQPFVYRFRVIDDPTLNAFAVPGGYVYFHSGTILSVTSIDELAGVMGHEIAHVKKDHYARMRAKSQIPDLLVGVAGLAAAVATEEPGLLVASQAANVAMKLRYSREFEAEADQYGTIFMVRAGYDPKGSVRFFERLLEIEKQRPEQIPPYLFSHPDVADRIEAIEIAAREMRPTQPPTPNLEERLRVVQSRLARLEALNRTSLPAAARSADRPDAQPVLDAAQALAEDGDVDSAIELLSDAERRHPEEPRIPYRIAEWQLENGRFAEAAAAYRRTAALDDSRAKVFYQMGLAYAQTDDRPRAVYAFEQAAARAGETSQLREQADWEIFKLIFTILPEAGFADGGRRGDTPVGDSREVFVEGDSRLAWWGRVNPRFRGYVEAFVVRWTDPRGRVVKEDFVEAFGSTRFGSVLELDDGATPGTWTVDLLLGTDRVERQTVMVRPREA